MKIGIKLHMGVEFMLVRLKENKGSGLMLVLIVMMLMVVLGTTALATMGTEGRQAAMHDNRTQAYYLARSGAEIAHEWLKKQDYNLDQDVNLNGSLDQGFSPGINEDQLINIRIFQDGQVIHIKSVGNFKGITEEAQLVVTKESEGGFSPSNDTALYVSTNLSFEGSTKILGNVVSNFDSANQINFNSSGGQYISGNLYLLNPSINKSQIAYGSKIQGNVIHINQHHEAPLPDFPSFPSLPTHPNVTEGTHGVIWNNDINITDWQVANYTLDLNNDYKFRNINMNSGRVLNVNVGTQDRKIVVENINIQNGFINIVGTGKLTIYVTGNITFNNGRINDSDKINQLTIYLKNPTTSPPKTVNVSGSQKIYGSLHAENANIELFNSGGFQGHIITGGNSVIISGAATANVRMIYAPKAKVSIIAGAYVKGAVVSKELFMSGNTTLEFQDTSGDDFLEGIIGNKTFKSIWR